MQMRERPRRRGSIGHDDDVGQGDRASWVSDVYWESTSVKSERPDLPVTIARLVRSATLMTPLEAPSSRVARWTITSPTPALVSVVIVRMRPDVAAQMVDGCSLGRPHRQGPYST